MKKISLPFIAIICCLLLVLVFSLISGKLFQKTEQSQNTLTQETTDSPQTGVQVGDIAPDFSLITIDSKKVTLSSLKGKPALFAFVLTVGCESCVIEAESVKEAQRQTPFTVIQLAINPSDTVEDLENFRNQFGASDWLIGYDKNSTIAQLYSARAIDTTVIVDANGKIIYRDDGIPVETEIIVKLLTSPQL